MKNLGSVIRHDNEEPALVDLGDPAQPRNYSHVDLQRLANGVASNLDITRGTRIGILAENSVEYLAYLVGIMRAGGIAVPINFRFPDSIIAYIVSDAELSTVFTDAANRNRLTPDVEVHTMKCEPIDTYSVVEPDQNEPGLILYTSGSTGMPKGVVLSHDSQRSMIERAGDRFEGQCAIVAAPLYHMNAILMLFMFLYSGGKVVLLPRFDAKLYLQAIDTYAVNSITGIPTMLAMMLRERDLIEELDLTTVTSISIGSSPLSETVANQASAIFPNASISNGYGTTEAGALMFGLHPDGLPTPTISLGFPSQHVQVRLVNGATPTEGVFEVKSPAAMNEYLNLPEKTAEKAAGDGWINTGDTMRVDENGFYFFIGRDDDMFNCSGENIYPGEVERILEADPRISEACVVPLPDPIRGQVPVAFIVASTDPIIDEQGIKDIVLANAPAYMHPRHAIFLQEMPLAGTSKIDRKALEALANSSISRDE
ncbi:MAG: class I adenylate-forming enzyme family protein [bacterium]|nr:long-chain fatty acid--CoA ligase [Gammaproteobacteria bacterium]